MYSSILRSRDDNVNDGITSSSSSPLLSLLKLNQKLSYPFFATSEESVTSNNNDSNHIVDSNSNNSNTGSTTNKYNNNSNNNDNNNKNKMIPNALGSACAGIISRIFTHPLDTAKARLQAPTITTPTNVVTSTSSASSLSSSSSIISSSSVSASTISNRPPQQHYKGPFDVIIRTLRTEGIRGLYRGFGVVLVGGTPGTVCYLCTYEYSKETLVPILNNRRRGNNYPNDNNNNNNNKNNNNDFIAHFLSGMIAETIACIIYVPVDVIKVR
jgi:Mitochondrial carrier protein